MSDRLERWIIDLPTRVHLWGAERELRRAAGPDESARDARALTIERLRAYRRARRFPRNRQCGRPTPVFIDAEQRYCAVGQLMREAGMDADARTIARTQNLARVPELTSPALTAFSKESGVSTDELARIQPAYVSEGPSFDPLLVTFSLLGLVYLVLPLFWAVRGLLRRGLGLLGIVLGGFALVAAIAAVRHPLAAHAIGPGPEPSPTPPLFAVAVALLGLVCVYAGIRQLVTRVDGTSS